MPLKKLKIYKLYNRALILQKKKQEKYKEIKNDQNRSTAEIEAMAERCTKGFKRNCNS